ncbi:MAG: sulfatase-like hydrolase/transferase [Pirellulaceae bacterium]
MLPIASSVPIRFSSTRVTMDGSGHSEKWNLYDDGIRTPLVVSWPGRIAAESTSYAMVSWIDLLPTVLEAVECQRLRIARREIDPTVLSGQKTSHRSEIFY